jgi:hypothetical protein
MNRSVSGCECNEILASSLKCVLALLSFVSRRRFGLVERDFCRRRRRRFCCLTVGRGWSWSHCHISFLEV